MDAKESVYKSFLENINRLNTDKPVDFYGTEFLAQMAMQLTTAELLQAIVNQLEIVNEVKYHEV